MSLAMELRGGVSTTERDKLSSSRSRSLDAYEYLLRGSNYFQTGDAQSEAMAEPFFEKAIELDPNLAEAYVGIGAIHSNRHFRGGGGSDDLLIAERHFRHALQINPRLGSAQRGLIRVGWERGQPDVCLGLAKEARLRGSDDVEDLLTQGWGYTLGGLPEKAIPALDRVLDLDPANQGAAWYRVVALAWAGELDRTQAAGKAYIRKFGEDAEIYHWLAVTSQCGGAAEEARVYHDRSLVLTRDDPRSGYATKAIQFYDEFGPRATADSIARHLAGVVEQQLLAAPDNGWVRCQMGYLYGFLGQRTACESLADDYIHLLRTDESSTPGDGLTFAAGLIRVGDTVKALDLLRADLERCGALSSVSATPCLRRASGIPESFERHEEVRELLRRAESELVSARSRY